VAAVAGLRAGATSVLVILLTALNLSFWGIPVLVMGLGKLVLRGQARRRLILMLAGLGDRFVAVNNRIFDALLPTEWDVQGLEGLRTDGRYLVISNHVSWTDIFVIFRVLHRHVALPRFFIKQELIWLPVVGQAAWALEFPFMRRYSAEYLARHPEKRGRDLETTRLACQRYREIPVAILNFLEGTRFTVDKHEEQESPYRMLLRPRVGGVTFVLDSLGDQLDGVVDVTIKYPHQDVSIWDFASGRISRIAVRARLLSVPDDRARYKEWIEGIWREKDQLLASL
jgi:1-acyl-sn-glycerol-3-phosphate acyltransferase